MRKRVIVSDSRILFESPSFSSASASIKLAIRFCFWLFSMFVAVASPTFSIAAEGGPPVAVATFTPMSNTAKLALDKMNKEILLCNEAGISASKMCLSTTNPWIIKAGAAMGGILAGISATDGQKDQCKKFGSAMDIANAALTTYNAVCTAAQIKCATACAKGKVTKDGVVASLTKAQAGFATTNPAEAGLIGSDIISLNSIQESQFQQANVTCKGYLANLAAGAAGLMSVIKSAKSSKGCEDEIEVGGKVDCKIKPDDPECVKKPLDCSLAENRTTVDCICRANPRTAGCPGGGGNTGRDNNTVGSNTIGNPDNNGNIGAPDLSGGSGDTPAGERSLARGGADSGSGSGAGAAGGSGGNSGGLGGGGTGAKPNAAAGGKPLNANILSGYDGGGGGGGGRGSGSGGDSDSDSALKRFLPGGANDPRRGLAGVRADGMTGAGGLTNWEKVKNRYGDNKNSLLGGGP